MRRLTEIEEELEAVKAELDRIEAALDHVDDMATAQKLMLAAMQTEDMLRALRQELWEAEDMASARERASDRAWGRWRTT